MAAKTPQPKTVKVECSVCGLDWNQHKPDAKGKVGLDECVRLLKAAVAKPKPFPYVQCYSQPATLSGGISSPHFL